MDITVIGINYHPESTGIGPFNTGLCEHLSQKHQVRMISTFPYYPEWKKRPEDQGKWSRSEERNGVLLHRMWHYVPARASAIKRMIHELSFIASASLRTLFSKKPDIYVVVSPPLLSGIPIAIIAKLRGVPVIFHIQDLQPDAAVWLGMLTQKWLIKTLYVFELWTYKLVDKISGITPAMVDTILSKGIPSDKVELLPNWISIRADAEMAPRKQSPGLETRRTLGFPDDCFLAVYSGNLGSKQGLDVLLDVATELKTAGVSHEEVSLLICGDGAEKKRLEATAHERQLDNLFFRPLLPYEQYQSLLNSCDINLVTQVAGSGKAFFPSKVLSILAAGCPVLGVSDTDSPLHQAINEGGAGFSLSPENPTKIAQLLQHLKANPQELEQCSSQGFNWVKQFAPETVLAKFEKTLEELAGK